MAASEPLLAPVVSVVRRARLSTTDGALSVDSLPAAALASVGLLHLSADVFFFDFEVPLVFRSLRSSFLALLPDNDP